MNEQTLNIKFVQEVEKYPCLYNNTLTDYSRKDIVEKAWCDVGKTFNLTESQSKDKWKNLRAVYVRHLKPTLSGSSSKPRKPYYLADVMEFIIPYIKILNTTNVTISGNLPQDVMEQEYSEEANELQPILQENVSSPSQNIPSPTYISCPLHAPPSSDESLSPTSGPSSKPTTSSKTRFNRRKMKKEFSTDDDDNVKYFEAKRTKHERKTEDVEDAKRMFLLSLLPDLKAMSDSQTRTFKRRVLALVDEILEESA